MGKVFLQTAGVLTVISLLYFGSMWLIGAPPQTACAGLPLALVLFQMYSANKLWKTRKDIKPSKVGQVFLIIKAVIAIAILALDFTEILKIYFQPLAGLLWVFVFSLLTVISMTVRKNPLK
jgi:hypothetical protein